MKVLTATANVINRAVSKNGSKIIDDRPFNADQYYSSHDVPRSRNDLFRDDSSSLLASSSKTSSASHYRSRSGSGRFRSLKNSCSNSNKDFVFYTSNDCMESEPIYSEPITPPPSQQKGNHLPSLQKGMIYPDPRDPVQICNHIYEYLVNRKTDASHNDEMSSPPDYVKSHNNNYLVNKKGGWRRCGGSLSSSPSSGSSSHSRKLYESGEEVVSF
ncbi:unnamed protein product [Lepeophtheirus salmonis]|uniref:(salmon louse) hypothetical protein n=1 Tax=Lepeophtheirus salmonis TaxID=72036 RepID=A0A7R8GZE7_LEPSM|nr:unnamed protein product [Lepeophtheirus salmonis]CAF2762699.1 unnamed protein product [Lepeophtheirus salmonis]